MGEVYEVLYDFEPQSNGDMRIKQGQRVEITERLSNDWAKGKNVTTGDQGVFPLNYVKPADTRDSEKFSRPAAPHPQQSNSNNHYDSPQAFNDKEKYQAPPANWGNQQQNVAPPQYQQQQQYYPPQNYVPQQQVQQQPYPESVMMPQQQQQQQQPQQKQKKHTGFGNVAKRFGDSVVFGAGATLGGDLINSIF